jgi:hypothetical protein
MTNANRYLQAFLCYSSDDRPFVEKIYSRLMKDKIYAWFDKKNLLPGQSWQLEIPKAVRNSDVVIVFLSPQSVSKEGFVQKEIKIALDAADEKPNGTIFIIPARLEVCDVPERMSKFHWVDLFESDGYDSLLNALRTRADNLGIINWEVHLKRGLIAYSKGDFKATIEEMAQVLHDEPNNVKAHNHQGLAYYFLENYAQSIAAYTKAIEANPSFAYSYEIRGISYYCLGQYNQAIADYTKAIELTPNNPCLWCRIGLCHHAQNDHRQAIADYTKAIEIGATCDGIHYRRGTAYQSHDEKDKAIADLQRCLELETDLQGRKTYATEHKLAEERLRKLQGTK